jgi:hypothetical protein
MKLINGNEFSKISHFSIDYDISGGNPYKGLSNDILKSDSIIYCKIDYIDQLFSFIKNSDKRYVLITHDSDYSIDEKKFNKKPRCIKKWFSKNIQFKNDILVNIPIGLENQIRHKHEPKVDYYWISKNLERFNKKKKISDTVYCNWNPKTNTSRNHIISEIKNKIKIEFEENRISHKSYCEKLSKYKFVICPEGNGISTHRFWETLYLGSIPIVINNMIYDSYNLPIVKLNKWSDISLDILNNFDVDKFSKDQLDFKYWENTIITEFNKIKNN